MPGPGAPRSLPSVRAWLLASLLLLVGCREQIVVQPDGGGTAADTGTGSNPGQDGGQSTVDAGSAQDGGAREACFVDPFDPCSDPDEAARTNNEWSDASQFTTSSVGCRSGDELTPLAESRQGILCQSEPADYFNLILVPCDTRVLRMQVRLRPLTQCPDDRLALELRAGGGIKACGDTWDGELIECLREGPDRIMRLLINPDLSVQSWYFAVLSDFSDVRFEYDLEVSVQ